MSYYFNSNEVDFDILTCPILGMDEKSKIEMQLSQYSRIVTVEDHLIDAGYESQILEGLEYSSRSKLRIFGLSSEVCGMVDNQSLLNHKGGISKANIDKFLQEKYSRKFSRIKSRRGNNKQHEVISSQSALAFIRTK